ncbi:cytochrome P450 [Actinomycetospora straminea]|uniref:Cytochrome P450 n=1 Tax=Actinomycetospora straminea TaxID=663607 RepID=A0ABP9ENT2_9PSEU|nr:cytochrome P450 [Actinomycetospora straminea]MDD7933476.1 cytochrome P450 [Actinomycetospora straminea]
MSNVAAAPRRDAIDLYRPEALRDPYPLYAELRARGPVTHEPERDIWLVPGHAEAAAVLRDHRRFVSGDGATYESALGRTERYPLIETDPPEHTRIRRAVQPPFARAEIEQLRPGIESAAAAIVGQALAHGEVDAVPALAQPMPDRAMAMLTGLTPPSCQALVDWSDAVVRAQEPAADPRHTELLLEALTWLGADGIPGLPAHCLGRLIMDGGSTGGLDPEGPERLMTLASIWLAGVDSTGALLGNAIDAFVEQPDQWELLRARPDLVPNAVEELLRFEAPFRVFYRRTRDEAEVGGVAIPAGATVCAVLGSTGRDPRQFADPDRLDVTRENARTHLALGTSIHLCLGAPLARMEATSMLTELTRRVQRFERTGDAVRSPSGTMRKFDALPVRLVAA